MYYCVYINFGSCRIGLILWNGMGRELDEARFLITFGNRSPAHTQTSQPSHNRTGHPLISSRSKDTNRCVCGGGDMVADVQIRAQVDQLRQQSDGGIIMQMQLSAFGAYHSLMRAGLISSVSVAGVKIF